MKEAKEEILEELNAFLDAAENARKHYYTEAVVLASLVARSGAERSDIEENIRAFIEADKRYTKAVIEITCARARISRFLETDPKGGAL